MQGHALEEFYTPGSPAYSVADAAGRGDAAEVASRVRAGADPNAVGRKGMLPLIWAIGTKSTAGVEALLAAGADPNRRSTPAQAAVGATGAGDALEFSPMALVTGSPDTRWLALLLTHGGNPNGPSRRGEPLLLQAIRYTSMPATRLLVEHGAALDTPGIAGQTPLMLAAMLNQYDIVRYLIERGADWRKRDPDGSWLPVTVQNARISPDFAAAVEAHRWVRTFLEQQGVHFPVEEPWQRREREAREAGPAGRAAP